VQYATDSFPQGSAAPSSQKDSVSYAYNPAQALSHKQDQLDSDTEISAIDQRLQALQSFLKAAKTGKPTVVPQSAAT
jgi:hypothetical protein